MLVDKELKAAITLSVVDRLDAVKKDIENVGIQGIHYLTLMVIVDDVNNLLTTEEGND